MLISGKKAILLATTNSGKVREIKEMLPDWEFLTPDPDLAPPEENGSNFSENALLKARYYSEHSGMVTLADDSGLLIEALNGFPGIYSARFAAQGYKAAIEKLSTMLQSASPPHKAKFVCNLVLYWPNGNFEEFTGETLGEIIFPPRGEQGFGYDPIFQPLGYGKSFAELDKSKISHRAKALTLLKARLADWRD